MIPMPSVNEKQVHKKWLWIFNLYKYFHTNEKGHKKFCQSSKVFIETDVLIESNILFMFKSKLAIQTSFSERRLYEVNDTSILKRKRTANSYNKCWTYDLLSDISDVLH